MFKEEVAYNLANFICEHPAICFTIVLSIGGSIFAFGRFSARLKRVELDVEKISPKLDILINCFNRLIGKLEKLKTLSGLDDLYYKTSSPRALTENGMRMIEESGLKEFIDNNTDELFKKIEATKPGTNYDIEQLSMDIMLMHSGDNRINKAKEIAYQRGTDLNLMLLASGLYLRDLYLSKK